MGKIMKKAGPVRTESGAVVDSPINPFAGLGAPRKATKGSDEKKQQLPKVPRALTKKILRKIADLESSLGVQGHVSQWREIPSWQIFLEEYRGSVVSGITNPRFVQKYGPFCLASVEALEEAFQDSHDYDPADHLTQGIKSALGRVNRLGKVLDPSVQAKRMLRDSDYLKAPDAPRGKPNTPGSKGAIKKSIQQKTDVADSTFYQLVKELKGEI